METECENCGKKFKWTERHKDEIPVCSDCWNKLAHGEGILSSINPKTIRYVKDMGIVVCYDR